MPMIEKLPIIGVPIGDPSGIGPEIAVKAAHDGRDPGDCPCQTDRTERSL